MQIDLTEEEAAWLLRFIQYKVRASKTIINQQERHRIMFPNEIRYHSYFSKRKQEEHDRKAVIGGSVVIKLKAAIKNGRINNPGDE